MKKIIKGLFCKIEIYKLERYKDGEGWRGLKWIIISNEYFFYLNIFFIYNIYLWLSLVRVGKEMYVFMVIGKIYKKLNILNKEYNIS